jgi:TPR repeat protein
MHASLDSNRLLRRLLVLSCLFVETALSPPAHPRAQDSAAPSLITDLKVRAESNESFAKQRLVDFLSQADTVAPGYNIALEWARSASTRNDPDAQFILGYLYEYGHGVPRDNTKAAENYEGAALHGHSTAQNNLARLYSRGLGVPKDIIKAFRLFQRAAQQGNRIAQWNLGHAYYEGVGTPRDLAQAARWFRAAAELGDPLAQHDLATLYFRGQGVAIDFAEATRWERLAAEQGNVDAETCLGYFYETGKGVPLNYVAAYAWYSRASATGDGLASRRRKSLGRLMTPKQLVEANSFFNPKAAAQ